MIIPQVTFMTQIVAILPIVIVQLLNTGFIHF
jgi:hypothetical protein